jgi:hypothetical protein
MTETMKEYKTALGWKIFISIVAPPLCVLFGWVAYTILIAEPFNLTVALFMLPLSLVMILMFIFGMFDIFKSKLIFTQDGIKKVNLRKTKELSYTSIKGIKSDQNYVYIIPKNDNDKQINVSQYFGKKSEWHGLLLAKFPDLDHETVIEEEEKLYEDEAYGRTQEERDENITQTRSITKYLNYASWAAAVWLWFYPHPYNLATAVGIILPIIGLFLVYRGKGLIKVIDVENSAYPSLSTTLTIPPLAIMIRVLYDYDILEYQNVWIYTVLATPIVLLMIIRVTKGEFQTKSKLEGLIIYPFLTATIGLFIFFASITINCTFDDSTPKLYDATVIEKEVSESRKGGTRYLLTLGPWGDVVDETELGVSKSQYERVQHGEKVNINLNSGVLSIPWVYVTTK